eukprot:2434-Pelagococcus_subviridis.AAC.3
MSFTTEAAGGREGGGTEVIRTFGCYDEGSVRFARGGFRTGRPRGARARRTNEGRDGRQRGTHI